MNTLALFVALIALVLFLLEFAGWVRRSVLALGLAVLTAAWIIQLMADSHTQTF